MTFLRKGTIAQDKGIMLKLEAMHRVPYELRLSCIEAAKGKVITSQGLSCSRPEAGTAGGKALPSGERYSKCLSRGEQKYTAWTQYDLRHL